MLVERQILPPHPFFVGREQECALLEEAVRSGERLISIIGPSGIGKTSLAREVVGSFSARLDMKPEEWFCDLSSARTKEDLLAAMAMVLGIPRFGPQRAGDMQLVHALINRGPLLLVLDNFEYLEVSARELLSFWLSHAPDLQVVVTSLVSLGLKGENLFELGPLGAEDAVALYEARAKRLWSSGDRAIPAAERPAIRELVKRLDHLPLAIELAAARIRLLSPQEMLSRINERFDLLQTRRGGRHSSLEHAIHCSWELLDQREKRALARASVFRGGFTFDAAAEVLLGNGTPEGEVLDILEGLREKALLQVDSPDPLRFSLYESVQAFAARELGRMGGEGDALALHSKFFLQRGEEWARRSSGPRGPEAIQYLIGERENLLEAYRRQRSAGPEFAARLGISASIALALVGSPSSELELVTGTVKAARRSGDSELLARALRVRSMAMRRQGRLEEGREDLHEALALAQRASARLLEGFIWSELASGLDSVEAMNVLRRAQAIEEELGEPALAGAIHLELGLLAYGKGDLSESAEHHEKARDIFQASGELRNCGRALVNLSQTLLDQGDYRGARAALHDAAAVFRLVMDPGSEAIVDLGLGVVELSAGRSQEAERHLTGALTVVRRFGNRLFEGITLMNLGLLAFDEEEFLLARQRLSEGIALVRDAGDSSRVGPLLPFAAAVKAILGEVDEAQADFAEARGWLEVKPVAAGNLVIECLEGFLDLVSAREAAREPGDDEVRGWASGASKQEPAGAEKIPSSHLLVCARRIFERALLRYHNLEMPSFQEEERNGSAPRLEPTFDLVSSVSDPSSRDVLQVGNDASWFAVEGVGRVDLEGREPHRRLLQALVEQLLVAPGVGLSLEQLIEVGWPGEEASPAKEVNRVYKAIGSLRRAGLEERLLRHADGYLLCPSLSVYRELA